MKKTLLVLALIAVVIFNLGCSSDIKSQNNETTDGFTYSKEKPNADTNHSDSETTSAVESLEITTIEDLISVAQNADISQKGHYNAIVAFLSGDTEALAVYTNIEQSCLSGFETVKISEFIVKPSQTQQFSLDFSFTVSESSYPAFPEGEYNYYIDDAPVYWHSYDEPVLDGAHADLKTIMNLLPSAVISLDNSTPLLYEERFDVCAPYFIIQMESYFGNAGINEETLKQRMEDFFGIEDYILNDEYFETSDGVCKIKSNGSTIGVSAVCRITDIRETSDTTVEIDVSFFADKATLCLSHKVRYTFEKGDFAYGYRLLNAKVTEQYGFDPMWFNN